MMIAQLNVRGRLNQTPSNLLGYLTFYHRDPSVVVEKAAEELVGARAATTPRVRPRVAAGAQRAAADTDP